MAIKETGYGERGFYSVSWPAKLPETKAEIILFTIK